MSAPPAFVAIDFETADNGADSACAIGLVRVESGEITQRLTRLIRPPRRSNQYAHIHGIRWEDVQHEPTFAELWPTILPVLDGATFFAAHNASFDRRILHGCCAAAGILAPSQPFECTVVLARRTWRMPKNDLATLARFLGLTLNHHEAGSDAEACARILLAARAHLALQGQG